MEEDGQHHKGKSKVEFEHCEEQLPVGHASERAVRGAQVRHRKQAHEVADTLPDEVVTHLHWLQHTERGEGGNNKK